MNFEKIKPYLPPILTQLLTRVGKRKLAVSRAVKSPKALKTPRKKTEIPVRMFGRQNGLTLAVALALVAIGQYEIIKVSEPKTIWIGLAFFGAAAFFFLRAFRFWSHEGLSRESLPVRLEWGLFALVMVIAACFRVFWLNGSPNGIFMDQGFEGVAGLRILHEGYRPFYEMEPLNNPALLLYQLAAWFLFFTPTQVHLYLFFALLSLASFPLIYWTFRQLAGARAALLTIFILAVMRWHVNFSRNGFPTIEVPFYMFGTLSFLLYGLKSGKRWAFVVSSIFFSLGLYTYQSFKIFPIFVMALFIYEWKMDRESIRKNLKSILVFAVIFLAMTSPLTVQVIKSGSVGSREASNSILSTVHQQHSLKPLWEMVWKTALMFNRSGDDNERHNLPNHRMLDDISGCLFILGLAYSIARIKRRKYFFSIVCVMIMSLPCLLSVVPAHANRMLGVTPCLAFLISTPILALWGRIRRNWGVKGEWIMLLILLEPLFLIGYLNYDMYFNVQANNNVYWSTGFWSGYSIDATMLGKKVAETGADWDYEVPLRYTNHTTFNFLTYFEKDDITTFKTPEGYAPNQTREGKGLCYAFMTEQSGMINLVKSLYPSASSDKFRDKDGHAFMEFLKIPAESVAAAKGLKARFSNGTEKEIEKFPEDLPPGPYDVRLRGCLFIDKTENYRFKTTGTASAVVRVAGKLLTPLKSLKLAKGFYSVELDLSVPAGPASFHLLALPSSGGEVEMDSSRLTSLPLDHGLEAYYYEPNDFSGKPALVEWDPVVNFVNGTDFPYVNYNMSARWEGVLKAPVSGDYVFRAQTDENAGLWIDGKNVLNGSPAKTGSIHLIAGPHKIRLDFQKILGPSISLLWLPPGQSGMEVVPNEVFGLTEPSF